MPRTRDRAVTVVLGPDQRLLVIRRFKDGRRYCVLPGGGVEPNEQPADAALRLGGLRTLFTWQHDVVSAVEDVSFDIEPDDI